MLEQLYAYKEKYEKEVAEHENAIKEHENALVLSKAKVSVVCDMIADNEPKEETPANIDETY